LLEVGTGFHPELTGRENIYLNGAILGMRRGEIARKFDEIVAFAEVDKFIDTPVKRYSSGMYLRLAFAVAAHLETEVLVVDEVLAVGDAAFQKKCLGKMGEVANAGRTVLFVSHNMAAVQSLCAKGIYLQEGTLAYLGEISYAIQRYHASIFQQSAELVQPVQGVQFQDIRLNGRQDTVIDATRPFEVRVQVVCAKPTARHFLYCLIEDAERSLVVHARVDSSSLMGKVKVTTYTARIQFPALWLKPGAYVMQFKMIVDTVGTKGRYLSDPLMLDVKGNADPALTLGYLAPTIGWDLLSSEAAPGE
jgi:lipopolysaccharide transport system ATP-binding protein